MITKRTYNCYSTEDKTRRLAIIAASLLVLVIIAPSLVYANKKEVKWEYTKFITPENLGSVGEYYPPAIIVNGKITKASIIKKVKSSPNKNGAKAKKDHYGIPYLEVVNNTYGKSDITFTAKYGKITAKGQLTLTIKKYNTPFAQIKYASKDYTKQFKTKDTIYISYKAGNTPKGKLKITPKKGWKIQEIRNWGSDSAGIKQKVYTNNSVVELNGVITIEMINRKKELVICTIMPDIEW